MTNDEVYQRAYDEVRLRGLSPYTVEEYLGKLTLFLRYYDGRPIEEMDETEIRAFLLHLLDSGKSSGTVNIYNSALRFIFGAVLGRNLNYQLIPRRRQYREFPALMSKNELTRFFSSMDNLRDRAMFETAYGAGLRLSEITYLRVQDIDSEQMRIFIHHGKGGKDRYNLLFRCVAETIQELSADKKYLGATTGHTAVLHTWGQNLCFHPHIHCIVPGGGLTKLGKWLPSRQKFFLPVKVLSRKFRGKFLALFKQQFPNVDPSVLSECYSKEWVVYCKPPFKDAACVVEYGIIQTWATHFRLRRSIFTPMLG